MISEGSGAVILTTEEFAKAHGLCPEIEIAGWSMTSDARHFVAPNFETVKQCIAESISDAGISPDDIDAVNAHGTSTQVNDPIETNAVKTVFGELARQTPVSSIKSMIGHSIGAAGALEAIACIMAIKAGIIPPTINLDNPDPKCDLDYVPLMAREKELNAVMSNSFAFGGQNCTLIFQKFRT